MHSGRGAHLQLKVRLSGVSSHLHCRWKVTACEGALQARLWWDGGYLRAVYGRLSRQLELEVNLQLWSPSTLVGHLYLSGQAKQVTCSLSLSRSDPNSQLLQRGLVRASWLLYTEPFWGSSGRSAHNAVLVWTAQHPHVTPAITLFAWICIRPVLPFPLFLLRWSNLHYPTRL